MYKRRRNAKTRLVGPREQLFLSGLKKIKANEEYGKDRWYQFHSIYQNFKFFAIDHPYNSSVFDSVNSYAQYVHNMSRFMEDKWLELGYEKIDSLIEHYEAIIGQQEKWYAKQDKNTQNKYKDYLFTYYHRLDELKRKKDE